MKTNAKDFFMHLGAMVGLYVVIASFLNLLFSIINKAFPEIPEYSYYFGSMSPQISLPVATLLIIFPIFIILSWFNHRSYETTPEKKELGIRKWLTYVTLFVAGAVLAGDLVTVLYKFLNGQDLTAAFFLKALSVLAVAGLVFGFYLQDIRDKISKSKEKIWAVATAIIILVAIILGFSVIGSPKTQRLMRYDEQTVSALQNTQWQIINYWQNSGTLPEKFPSETLIMEDLQTEKPIIYKKTGEMSFELCATFNKESRLLGNREGMISPAVVGGNKNEDWSHPAGQYCFPRQIDPMTYPTQPKIAIPTRI